MSDRTGTCCRHCDADLPWERVSSGTTICVRCEAAKDGPPNGSAYMLAQDTIARLRAQLAAAVRRAEEAERAVGVLGDEAGGARKIVGLDLEWQAKQPCPTAPVYFLLQGVTQADECNYHDARTATDANPIAAAAIERARGGSNGE